MVRNQLSLNQLQKEQLLKKSQEPMVGVGILFLFQKEKIKQWETIQMKKDD